MDLLEAAEARKLRFAMTSATQSNFGASAYLGFLTALAGHPEVLLSEHLQGNEARALIKRFLGTVNRSAGSSGFLKDLLVERYDLLDAMVNFSAWPGSVTASGPASWVRSKSPTCPSPACQPRLTRCCPCPVSPSGPV